MGFCESRFVRCFRFKTFSCEAIREQTYLRVHRALIDRSQTLSFVDIPQRRDEDAGSKRRTVPTSKYRNSDNFEYRPYVFAYLNFCLAFAKRRKWKVRSEELSVFVGNCARVARNLFFDAGAVIRQQSQPYGIHAVKFLFPLNETLKTVECPGRWRKEGKEK